ncbi:MULTISPECIES: hypothetical protein [unclassified Nocardioides]|uniref:hypothetical protein n=1 Tax=unclassified Nocardioides TaxID=2615069 RepID=UPI000702CCF2|nr:MULTISPECIES: hypothetical protein [unclassified Nocardioides]KRC56959.1 hypothetical protein ASE19_03920 [Nocardioides sp. Root79]KRC77168.1 hypothetical protein ASE20_02785 [Nocardioides sp. Root240]
MTRIRIRRRRLRDDRGALLIFAILIVTVIALVTGMVLTRGDGSLRATVALRDVARSSYAADGAAQVAINALRTGYNSGNGTNPSYFTNAPGTGCFGYDTGVPTTAKNTLYLNGLIPKVGNETQQEMSARVVCEIDSDTGEQGTAVPINGSNKPGYAIVTLGDRIAKTGGTLTAAQPLKVHGGVFANGTITGSVNLDAGDVKATGTCSAATVVAPSVKRCADAPPAPAPTSDPNYNHELGSSPPALKKPPTSCTDGLSPSTATTSDDNLAVFTEGYYDSAADMNAAMNICPVVWFKPGNYYFDFHDETCSNVCPDSVYPGITNQWSIPSGLDVLGGTPTNPTTGAILARPPSSLPAVAPNQGGLIPGNCQSPITNVNAQGVQFVFGGNSRLYLNGGSSRGARMELCATYHVDRPPIELYGLKTGNTPSSAPANGLIPSGAVTTTQPQGTWTNATAAAVSADNGLEATWTTTGSGTKNGTITVPGFAPATAVPAGAILTGAKLRVKHKDVGNQSTAAFQVNGAPTATGAFTVPLRNTTSGVDTVDLATNATEFQNLQRQVHDYGFSGAKVTYAVKVTSNGNNAVTLDSLSLDLTYYVPVLRGEQGTNIETGGTSTPLLWTDNSGNNKINMYLHGTTYAPYGHMDITLSNFSAEVAKFGVIVRSLRFDVNTGNPLFTGPVFEIPDDSPGFGFETTLVRLNVYVCPGASCTSGGELALKTKVMVFDSGGTPGPPNRQVTPMSWSHTR